MTTLPEPDLAALEPVFHPRLVDRWSWRKGLQKGEIGSFTGKANRAHMCALAAEGCVHAHN